MGLMVPMVESVEQARMIVESAKYPPEGCRGASFHVAHDDYSEGDVQGKMQSAYGAFLDVHQASGDGRVDAPPDLRDAAIMNVARIYFDVERWDEAKKYYRMIGKRSPLKH